MGLIIPNAFLSKSEMARKIRLEEMAVKQQEYIDSKTRQSERGENVPELVHDTGLLDTSMNWDFAPGWEDRRIRFVKELRAQRKPFRPSARIPMPNGQLQNVYEGDEIDLKWFREGLCCVKCCNWKAEDEHTHAQEHRKLQEVAGPPPNGVSIKDLCAFCGSNLSMQQNDKREVA